MKNNILYIFYGCYIEYSLHPLYLFMKEQGYNCIEITTDTCNDMKKALYELNAKECVFITSAHVFLDDTYWYFKNFNNSPVNLSALEVIDILKPIKIVHYPHDLACLVHDFDAPWLYSIFDLILFPIDGYSHLSCNGKQIYNVGWIKKNNEIGTGTRFNIGHGIGEYYMYYSKGFNYFLNTFKIVWDNNVIIKGSIPEKWETDKVYWEENKIKYIDPSKSIFELINSCEIMLTNALTSVTLESALSGRYTINMLDDIFNHEEHEKYFKGIPNLKMMTINETADLLKEYKNSNFIPEQGEDLLKQFDFELSVKLITN